MNIHFANPYLLLLCLLPIIWLIYYGFIYPEKRIRIKLSYDPGKFTGNTIHKFLRPLSPIFSVLALLLWIIALARPQTEGEVQKDRRDGMEIQLLLDVSGSMETEDLEPNRLEAAKDAISKFIKHRTQDRIGIILFAENAFSYAPLTHDHAYLQKLITEIKPGILPKNGTALGMAMATAIQRMQNQKSSGKICILITDGASNRGKISPQTAAEMAAERGIRFYTLSVGRDEFWVKDPVKGVIKQKTDWDESSLKYIARITGAEYFRAEDNESLSLIFELLNTLPKKQMDIFQERILKDIYPKFIQAGLICFLLSLGFKLLYWYNPLEE